MQAKANQPGPANLPLGRVLRLKDLEGWADKFLVVPPERLGVVIYPNGEVRSFPPGRHKILSALDRLQGKSVGLQAGYITLGDYTASLKLAYMLSGDGELLDGVLVCALEVGDPGRFFQRVILPLDELRNRAIELDATPVQEALGALTPQYAAGDLARGRLDSSLFSRAEASLGAFLDGLGLRLRVISLLAISRSENRAVIAEKAQKLRERLQSVEIEQKMADIENQLQLEDFIHQVAPGVEDIAHFGTPSAGADSSKAPKGGLGRALGQWLGAASSQAQKARPVLENLFNRKQAEAAFPIPKTPRQPKRWWLGRVIWMLAVIGLGIILSLVFSWIAYLAGWESTTEVMIIIWGFVITVILESVKYLYEKRELLAEEAWMKHGYQHLDNLVGNDRQWADALVREQCANELSHINDVISAVRSREYQRGKIELALEIKNKLERNLEDCLEKVRRGDFGRPPYVTDVHISQRGWENMLDNDEDLLLYANVLSDRADLFQQKSHKGELNSETISEFDAEISKFRNRFFERGRYLQAPAVETTQK